MIHRTWLYRRAAKKQRTPRAGRRIGDVAIRRFAFGSHGTLHSRGSSGDERKLAAPDSPETDERKP